MSVNDLLRQLRGEWSFNRRVTQPCAVMRGRAHYVAVAPDHLDYFEEGEMQLRKSGGIFQFFRSYRYVKENDALVVYFADGKNVGELFHHLSLVRKVHDTFLFGEHHCGDDLYRSRYRFFDPHRFNLTHKVSGPRKSYITTTTFNRFSH